MHKYSAFGGFIPNLSPQVLPGLRWGGGPTPDTRHPYRQLISGSAFAPSLFLPFVSVCSLLICEVCDINYMTVTDLTVLTSVAMPGLRSARASVRVLVQHSNGGDFTRHKSAAAAAAAAAVSLLLRTRALLQQ